MEPETYELEPEPTKPDLPGSVVVGLTTDEVIDAAAADLLAHAKSCVRAFGDFHLALSGGSTPEPLYRRLMYDPGLRDFPWKKTHLWVVDERRVPLDDERSNFRMLREVIVDHSDIPAEQVHPIRATDELGDASYERELRANLEWREKGHDRLDYALLGMGDDAHTASLFPNSPALDAGERLVVINEGEHVTPPDRVTMTYHLLNASRFIGVLVLGERKRGTIARVANANHAHRQTNNQMTDHKTDRNADATAPIPPTIVRELPILGIHPLAGEQRWYLDADACP